MFLLRLQTDAHLAAGAAVANVAGAAATTVAIIVAGGGRALTRFRNFLFATQAYTPLPPFASATLVSVHWLSL